MVKEKILVVDDVEDNRNLLRVMLVKHGYSILSAENGLEAVALAEKEQPDLILLDIMMPVQDGFEACMELKGKEITKDIPVIFLSAKDDVTDKLKGLELGAADYITKPFNKAEVIARTKTQLKLYGLTRTLAQANDELREKQDKIDEDLIAAAHIQHSLIPSEVPAIAHCGFAFRFVPSDLSGGDIFNILRLDEDFVVIYIADVCGHGVPAAMVTVAVAQSLQPHGRSIVKDTLDKPPYYRISSPLDVVEKLDQQYPLDRFGRFFTIAYILLNIRTGELRYCNAGHQLPVLQRQSGEIELLEAGGPIIGMGDMVPFEEGCVTMHPGDRLYLYTDGIVEHTNPDDDYFGEERLYGVIAGQRAASLDECCTELLEEVRLFADGCRADDDITLVALEYDPEK